MSERTTFKPGDRVRHRSSREEAIVAKVINDGQELVLSRGLGELPLTVPSLLMESCEADPPPSSDWLDGTPKAPPCPKAFSR